MSSEPTVSGVFDEITAIASLDAALERVTLAAGSPGPDGQSIAVAAADRACLLTGLRDELLTGTYVPGSARRVEISREDGRTREVFISNVRDRVVSSALAQALSARLDDRLHDAAHGYRKGRSTRTALGVADALLRAVPEAWVVRLDIAQFFESVRVEAMLDCVRACVDEDEVIALVGGMLRAGTVGPVGYDATEHGLPTGSSLSPLLANLYLAPVDEVLTRASKGAVRYGDDVLVVCEHEAQASLIERVARAELARLGLRINEQKLRRCSLGDGFLFLGFEVDARGRRPSERATTSLCTKVSRLLAERPHDGSEELRSLLRGWHQHYGSFEQVELPRDAQRIAIEVEEASLQNTHVQELEGASLVSAEASRDARGESASREAFRRKLHRVSVSEARRAAMFEALDRVDGGALAELLASDGKHALAAEALRLERDEALRVSSPPAGRERKREPVAAPASGRVPVAWEQAHGAEDRRSEPSVLLQEVAVASPLSSHPRALAVVQGCAVVRALVDKATVGKGLETSERYLLADVLGRLGQEAEPALEAVFKHLTDHRPGMAKRHLLRLYPMPTSCAKIRRNMAQLAAEVGCSCRFRPPPGAYPTPVLHAVTATEVPALEARVRQTPAPRGAVAKAALAAVNAGRVELGERAAALCARMADLRRQIQVQQRALADLERRLGEILDEAGDGQLETPSGALKRELDAQGRPRFVLEV